MYLFLKFPIHERREFFVKVHACQQDQEMFQANSHNFGQDYSGSIQILPLAIQKGRCIGFFAISVEDYFKPY